MHLSSLASSARAAIAFLALGCVVPSLGGCGTSKDPADLDENGSPAGGNRGADDDSLGNEPEPGASPEDGGLDEYPAGPYGWDKPDVDEVVENLSLRGLLNLEPPALTASLDIAPLDLQALRETEARYLLVITAMAWCGSCQAAARQLGAELLDRVTALRGEGALVANLLLEGGGSAPPTDAELSNWAQAYSLPISVFGPVDDEAARVFPEREWAFVLRLDTMQVVWRQQVSLYALPTTSQLGVAQLEALVAQ